MNAKKDDSPKKGKINIGAVIILIISAVVFLPAGGVAVYQGFFGKSRIPVFGTYNGKKITYERNSKFAMAVSNISEQYRKYGIELNDQTAPYVYNQAFMQTARSMAYTDFVKQSKWSVPESKFDRQLKKFFSDENGKFMKDVYNQMPDSDLNRYKSYIMDDLTVLRFQEDVFGGSSFAGKELYGLKSNNSEEEFIKKMGNEYHSFVMAEFNTNDYPKEEAVAYAKNNAESFTHYNLSAITLDSEADAKSLLKQIKAEEITFENAVNDKSQKYYTDNDGKVTSSYRYQLTSMLDNEDDVAKVINLNKDDLSEVIKTQIGYTIFRTDAEPESADFTKAETVDVVMSYIKANEKGMVEEYYLNKAKKFAEDTSVSSFKKVCENYNIEAKDIEEFPLNYGNTSFYNSTTSVSPLSSISSNAEQLESVFKLRVDEVSQPFVIDSSVVVVKCTGIETKAIEASKAENDEEASDEDDLSESVKSADRNASESALSNSDKFVNNFYDTYYSTFTK